MKGKSNCKLKNHYESMLATIHTKFVNDQNIFILSILNTKHKRNAF